MMVATQEQSGVGPNELKRKNEATGSDDLSPTSRFAFCPPLRFAFVSH